MIASGGPNDVSTCHGRHVLGDAGEDGHPALSGGQRQCPRTGRKPGFDDWKMAVLIMVAILHRRKSKSAQYRWILEHRADLLAWLELPRLPARSTFFARYRRIHKLYTVAIEYSCGQKEVTSLYDRPTAVVLQHRSA
jgi:hypothetical protein